MTEAERAAVVGYLGHQPELLSASVKENVLLGSDGPAAPWLAASCLTEEVAAMPQGEDTAVGSGGVRLSGGQQARVNLARALMNSPELLLVDEPTAALDREAARMVTDLVIDVTRRFGAATLYVTHDPGQADRADRVLEMVDGRLGEKEPATTQ